ncbi:MAG: hypothetical protein EOM24_03820, partial [Chloroflexia bacterium]|nr:hypothetical protein [Chloroflexia bacterium]
MIRIDLLWARAANRISDPIEEFRGIAAHFELAIMQNNIEEAEKVLPRMHYIADSGQLPDKELLKHKHKLALYWMALGDKERAYKLWQEALEFQEQYNVNSYIDVRLYLANCLYSFGEVSKAKDLLAFALKDAVARVDKLNIVNAQLAL